MVSLPAPAVIESWESASIVSAIEPPVTVSVSVLLANPTLMVAVSKAGNRAGVIADVLITSFPFPPVIVSVSRSTQSLVVS